MVGIFNIKVLATIYEQENSDLLGYYNKLNNPVFNPSKRSVSGRDECYFPRYWALDNSGGPLAGEECRGKGPYDEILSSKKYQIDGKGGDFYWEFLKTINEYDIYKPNGIIIQNATDNDMWLLSLRQDVDFVNLDAPFYIQGVFKKEEPLHDVRNFNLLNKNLSRLLYEHSQVQLIFKNEHLCDDDYDCDEKLKHIGVNYDIFNASDQADEYFYDEDTGKFQLKIDPNNDDQFSDIEDVIGYQENPEFKIITGTQAIYANEIQILQKELVIETKPIKMYMGQQLDEAMIKSGINPKQIYLANPLEIIDEEDHEIEKINISDYGLGVEDLNIESIREGSTIFINQDLSIEDGEFPYANRVVDSMNPKNLDELTSSDVGRIEVVVSTEIEGELVKGIALIPATVVWGDSLAFRLNEGPYDEDEEEPEDVDEDDREATISQKIGSVYSLSFSKKDDDYFISSGYGNIKKHPWDSVESVLNSTFELANKYPRNDKYIQIDIYSNNIKEIRDDFDDEGDIFSQKIDYGDSILETPKEFNDGEPLEVQLGNIVRVWIANPVKSRLYKYDDGNDDDGNDGEYTGQEDLVFKASEFPNGQWMYYEITKDGFKPFYNNQVTVAKDSIPLPLDSDEDDIDDMFYDNEHLGLDIPDTSDYEDITFEFKGIEKYPDTSQLGETVEGIVQYSGVSDEDDDLRPLSIVFNVHPNFIISGEKLELFLKHDEITVSKKFKTNSEEEQKKEILTLAQPYVKQGEEIIADDKQIDLFDVEILFTNSGKTEGTAEICYREQSKLCEEVSFKEDTKPDPILWITDYDKWKNPSTSVVPKENSFMMMYSNEVKVVAHSSNIRLDNAKDKAFYSITQENPWIQLSNVGYYKGQSVGLKIILKPSNVQNSSEFNYISIGSHQFLTISMNNNKDAQLDITYEFLDESGKALKISGLWYLATVTNNKIVTMNTNQIKNIYSISRDGVDDTDMKCTTCSLVSYQLVHNNNQEFIEFIGKGHDNPQQPPGAQPNQFQLAFTFDEKSSLNLKVLNKYGITDHPSLVISYVNNFDFLKVGIPDPESQNQKTEKITPQNKGTLTNEFIQYIPYLGKDHRPKKLEWIVTNKKEYNIFNPGTWKITDEKGIDRTHLFNIDVNTGTISVKNIDDNSLYNHYYHFNYTLPFNKQAEIDEKALNKDNYLVFEQDIIFNINQQKAANITSQHLINFNADVTYQYVDVSGKNLKDSEVMKGILTKNYPVEKPKDISKYVFKESDPKNLSQEKIQYTDSTVKFIYEEGINWLPNYSKWDDSNTSIIPKENAFTLMFTEDTMINKCSNGIEGCNNGVFSKEIFKNKDKVTFLTNKGPQWLIWENIGYYEGHSINVKLIVDSFGSICDSPANTIDIKGDLVFSVSVADCAKSAKIAYEFLDKNNQPIKISGHWNLGAIQNMMEITMPTAQIDTIYGISRGNNSNNKEDCVDCSLLVYSLQNKDNKEMISITGKGLLTGPGVSVGIPPGIQQDQLFSSFTYTDRSQLEFDLKPINNKFNNFPFYYNKSGFVTVALPDPEPLDQQIDKITPENREKLMNEFVQYIPFEPKNKRNQIMSWEIPKANTIDVFSAGSWEITNEKGENKNNLFNFDQKDQKVIIIPKNIQDDDIYNHMYKFKYTLPFNEEKRVRKDQLDQNNYLTYEQVIDFKVNNEQAVQIKPKIAINMNAKVSYEYLDTTKKEISSKETKQGLITDPYPITDAKYINNYAFKESIPNNLSQEKLKYTDNSVQFIYEEGLSWLPNYSKWLDAEKNIIPKENAFMMMYSDDTEVVAWSDGIDKFNDGDIKQAEYVIYPTDQGPQWVKWKNVGYYQGTPVDLKLTVSDFGNTQLNKEQNKLYLQVKSVFSVRVSKETKKVSVNYEFFNSETGEPIEVTGYWNLSNIDDAKMISMDTKQIEHIYSISRDGKGINDMICTTCTLLTYDIDNQNGNEKISITGHGHFASISNKNRDVSAKPPGIQSKQIQTTFTYKDKTNIAFDIESTPDNPFSDAIVSYNSSGLVKVALPDPEPLDQKVDQITPENRDHLTNEFIQYIPFEPQGKRDQKMSWELPKNTIIDIFKPGLWKIINEKGDDSTDLFNITEQDSGFKIEPKDITNSKLYNHYYKFQYKLLFDETKQVKSTELTKDNHLIYEQGVHFKVNNEQAVQIKPKTAINMNATVNYKYIDERSQEVIQEINQEALITQKTPKASETLENYKLIKVDPIDYDSKPILYTEQYVSLYFLENLFSIEVPDVLNFKTVDTLYKQSPIKDDEWPIEVTNLITDHWYVEIKQNTPLILKSTLKEICKGANSCFVYQTKDKELSLSMNTPIQLNSDEFKDNGKGDFVLIWGKDRESSLFFSGFKQKTTMGTYVSELEFNLINAL